MPKKQPRNAFYFYMQDFREQQRKKGIVYNNMKEVADAAGPSYRELSKSDQEYYTDMAKQEKQKYNIPEMKFTTLGESYADLERKQKEIKEAQEREIRDIKNIIRQRTSTTTLIEEDFFLMDVNYYCLTTSGDYVICECSLLSFNLKDGLHDTMKGQYHEIIHPGAIPLGYTSDAKSNSIELGIPLPDENEPKTDTTKTLSRIVSHLKKHEKEGVIAPIFTFPDKVEPVLNFIQHMCNRVATDDSVFRVYKLDTLFFHLINALAQQEDEGFPKESLAFAQLRKDAFMFTPGLGCNHHEETEKSVMCTLSRVKRWAYTILDHCCPVAGIEMKAGKHLPSEIDVKAVAAVKERNRAMKASIAVEENTKAAYNMEIDKKYFISSIKRPASSYSERYAPEVTKPQVSISARGRGGRGGGLPRGGLVQQPDIAFGRGRGTHSTQNPFLSGENFPALGARKKSPGIRPPMSDDDDSES